MKYWYETLGVRHPIKLKSKLEMFYFYTTVFVFDYLLQIRIFYIIISWLFFYLQAKLFTNIDKVKAYTTKHYGHIEYRIECDQYGEDLCLPSVDCVNSTDDKRFFQVDNHFYKPNVTEKQR